MRRVELLTPTQLDVVLMLADGMTAQKVADFLGVTHRKELEVLIRQEVGR